MNNTKQNKLRAVQLPFVLAAMAFAPSALAICVDSVDSDPDKAELVFTIDANNGCESINNHFGCHIKNPPGSCKFEHTDRDDVLVGFEAESSFKGDGSLAWKITQINIDKPIMIDVAVVGGATKGNNCGYGFEFDVAKGSGGDCKGTLDESGNCDGTIQNITSLDVCTDLVNEAPPPPPEVPPVATTLKACQTESEFLAGINGELDKTGIRCPIYTNDDLPPEGSGLGIGDQKPVVVCNLEKDKFAWGTTGANEEGAQEEVCCQCGIEMDIDQTCFVSDNPEENAENGCADTLTSDPTQEVILKFQRDDNDPCTKIVSGGKTYKTCW